MPSLRGSVYRDAWLPLMNEWGLYDEKRHSKMDMVYTFLNGSTIEFFGADSEQKLRGRARDIAWIDECNELDYDTFQQVILRTKEKVIVSYNPSAVDSYLYRLPEDKTVTIHSTYMDNPFLTKANREQIESYKDSDPDYYQIFTLGKRAYSRENIYAEWAKGPKPDYLTEWVYGLDFGYVHPTALVKIWYHPDKREIWLEEVIYEAGLTSQQIVERMREAKVDESRPIISETARPEIVQDIRKAGYQVINADKNVSDGIMAVKSFKIGVSLEAINIHKENYNYRYLKQNGKIIDVPIKESDDAMDAIRYGAMWIKKYQLKELGALHQETWNFSL